VVVQWTTLTECHRRRSSQSSRRPSVEKLLDDDERESLIAYLAANPTAGDLIPGTGGVRKLRWALEGRGKRGGARIIHFFHSTRLPLFLLTAFAKNERTDLSQADRNGLRTLTKVLVDTYGRRRT
jgi:hypothetical protein